jgi:thiamine-phosphate pyrophosphorylase
MAFEGGASVVQIREKQPTQSLANEIREATAYATGNQKLLVNDYVQLASLAHGVHLGVEDEPIAQAQLALGAQAILGATVHTLAELGAVCTLPVDYIGVGPVFGTNSKRTGLPPLGLQGLAHICQQSPFPVVAIGNIRPQDVGACLAAGAYGVAVLGGVCLAADPTAATMAYQRALDEAISLGGR